MDDDDAMLPPPPDEDVAPNFGGWELFALVGLQKKDERYFKRAVMDPQFSLNTEFQVTAAPEKYGAYEIAFGRVSVTITKKQAGNGMVKTDIQFDAPSHEKTGQAFHSVDECYAFQDWFCTFDKRVGPRQKDELMQKDQTGKRSSHDSLFFTIVRQKFFWKEGYSTGLLELLGRIPKEGRKYPDLTKLDGHGKNIYEVCDDTGLGEGAANCLVRAFPPPKKGIRRRRSSGRKKSCTIQ